MIRYCSILLVLLWAGIAHAGVIKVGTGGDVRTIKEAIERARPHDTLFIREGTYLEYDIRITKPLTILGENHPVVDGEFQGEIFTVGADSVTIDGLLIRGVQKSFTKDYAAVRVTRSRNFLLQNLILENIFWGIYLQKSSRGTVRNNEIRGDAVSETGAGNGIHLWHCQNVLIEKNDIRQMRDGIYFEFVDSSMVSENHSHHNVRYGLHFMFSNHDTYQNNVFEYNGAGVAVMFSKFIDMYHNTFRHNWGTASYGLLLKEINDAEIEGNIFEKNTIGVNVEGTNRISYRGNDFVENGWAVKVRGASYTNVFTGNNFLYNSFDLSFNTRLNDNSFDGNYWSAYTGYDLDKDGVGDVPFRPVNLFSYVVNRAPETIVLLRSLFMDIIDFSEKVSPVFTPDNLMDSSPLMKKIQ